MDRDWRHFLYVFVVIPLMFFSTMWISIPFSFVFSAQAILFGIVTKCISSAKGYPTGFHWGCFLSIVGVIIVARRPKYDQFEQWRLQKRQARAERRAARREKHVSGESRYYSGRARAIAISVLILLIAIAAAPGIVSSFQDPESEPLKTAGTLLFAFVALVIICAIASHVLAVALMLCCYLGNGVCNVIACEEKDSTEKINISQMIPTSAAIVYIGLLALLVKSNWPRWWQWLTHLFA